MYFRPCYITPHRLEIFYLLYDFIVKVFLPYRVFFYCWIPNEIIRYFGMRCSLSSSHWMALKRFFVISAVAIRPLSQGVFRDMCTRLFRILPLEEGKLYPKLSGRAIDPRASAPEESEEISFRINITNSISRRVPMDHDSHRRWHSREMYGWHQHMHERRAAAVSVDRPLSIAFWLSCCGHC